MHPETHEPGYCSVARSLALGVLSAAMASLLAAPGLGQSSERRAEARQRVGTSDGPRRIEAPAPKKLAPATLPAGGKALVLEGPEPESDVPYELREDPIPSGADLSGTAPIPAYLKGNPYRLSFWGGDYTPPKSERIDPKLAATLRSKAKTYGFVMFQGRITAAKVRRVEALGVELDIFHTFQCYTATIPASALPRLADSRDVRWVGYARERQKLDPRVFAAIATQGPRRRVGLHVSVFASDMTVRAQRRLVARASLGSPTASEEASEADHAYAVLPNGPFQRRLEELGARVRSYTDGLKTFQVEATLADALRIAREDFVNFVELERVERSFHDRSTRQIGVDAIRGSATSDGREIIVGILDSGFQVRNSANPTGHRDLAKWTIGWNFTEDAGSVYNDAPGHGTHVAGTLIGTGTVNRLYRGCAPGAGHDGTHRIYLAKVIGDGNSNSQAGIQQFRLSRGDTPRPHVINYSGGSEPDSTGYYGSDVGSREVDFSTYQYKQIYVISAGNSGSKVQDHIGGYTATLLRSCGAPAVSKNAFAVANLLPERRRGGSKYFYNVMPRNKVPILPGVASTAGRTYAIGLSSGAYAPNAHVRGFRIDAKLSEPTSVKGYLWLRDSTTGLPSNTAIRTASAIMDSGMTEFRFNQPITVLAGQRYFIGFETPSGVTMTGPWTNDSRAASSVCHYKTNGSWSAGLVLKPIYEVIFDVETGEVDDSSSVGPTADGRLKPNIAAPGSWIVSCRAWTQDKYATMSGTSMASPHVAGCVADMLHADTLQRRRPAMAKAMIAATANMFGQTASWDYKSRSAYYRQGLGQVDAYRSIYSRNSSSGWQSARWYGSLFSTSSGAAVEWTVPEDADRMMLTLNFDERAPNHGAKRACLADLDLYVDVYPFSSGSNTGEYSSRRAWDTWDWLSFTSSIGALRGKRIRIKVFPRVRPASGTRADFGIGLMIQRGDPAPNANLRVQAPAAVQPDSPFNVLATVDVPSMALTNTHLTISPDSAFDVRSLFFRTPEGHTRLIQDAAANTLGNLGFWYPSLNRTFNWQLASHFSKLGKFNLCVTMRSDNFVGMTSNTKALTRCTSVCVDGSGARFGDLKSSSHQIGIWSNKSPLVVQWNKAIEEGCAAPRGYAYRLSTTFVVKPTTINAGPSVTSVSHALTSSTQRQYFSVRAQDAAANWSTLRTFGPFYYDAAKPGIQSVTLDAAAQYTRDLTVALAVQASDAHSGVTTMRYTNGLKWSPWVQFRSPLDIDLSSHGGNTDEGRKTVQVQVRDRAGNISDTREATIVYDKTPPVIQFVRIDNGAKKTTSLICEVEAPATGGATQLRYSWDDKTWSPWMKYIAGIRKIDLRSYGGSSLGGPRTMHVQARDAAGNVSPSSTSTITYYPPLRIGKVSPGTIFSIDQRPVGIEGVGFRYATRVRLGGTTHQFGTTTDWIKGWFQVLDDTRIRLYLPPALEPATYQVIVDNPCFSSKPADLTVAHNTSPALWSPPTWPVSKPVEVFASRGLLPETTLSILTLSLSDHALRLSAVLELEHGGHATLLMDPSFVIVPGAKGHDEHGIVRWQIPVTGRAKTYFEAILIGPTKVRGTIPTTNRNATKVQ